MSRSTSKATTLYLIEILHQTTTLVTLVLPLLGCILSKFYIKPQQAGGDKHRTQSCILSKFYIKPQPPLLNSRRPPRCILSKFYIKPQQCPDCLISFEVVSYRNSTSNHNYWRGISVRISVVSYRNSTSNHNTPEKRTIALKVVSYRNSTSNHNDLERGQLPADVVSYRNSTSNHNKHAYESAQVLLYLIEILHQTTTNAEFSIDEELLYLIEILHQTTTLACVLVRKQRCILSKFYIKPQLLPLY